MSTDGESGQPLRDLELHDVVVFHTTKDEKKRDYEVVGLVEDEENTYGVLSTEIQCMDCSGSGKKDDSPCEACAGAGTDRQFIVTDAQGNLIENQELAQEILDDFFILLEESGDKGGAE